MSEEQREQTARPTGGKWKYQGESTNIIFSYDKKAMEEGDNVIAHVTPSNPRCDANGFYIAALHNAATEINPDNPRAVVAGMAKCVEALEKAMKTLRDDDDSWAFMGIIKFIQVALDAIRAKPEGDVG